jgi:DNA-binding transcriptional ArsR family regulator
MTSNGGLHGTDGFLKDARMAESAQAVVVPAANTSWDEDLIYATLADPARRRLLLALARGGPQPGVSLKVSAGRTLTATVKHLAGLRKAGLVLMQENPRDGRRQLYALSPLVPVTKTETGAVVDFGFCTLRL